MTDVLVLLSMSITIDYCNSYLWIERKSWSWNCL